MADRLDSASILAIIARLSWRPARSMPQIPHEYTVRKEARDEADYWMLHQAIAALGVLERWHGGRVLGDVPIIRRNRGRPGLYYLLPLSRQRVALLVYVIGADLSHHQYRATLCLGQQRQRVIDREQQPRNSSY